MAATTLIPPKPLETKETNSLFKKSSKSFNQTQKSVQNISKLLNTRIKVRKQIFSDIFETKRRREFDTRRMETEDEREARRSVPSGISNVVAAVSKTGGSLIGRLVKALGFIAAGWILRTLPTWIGYAKEFIARVNEIGRIIKSFVTNVGNIFQSSFRVLTSLKDNILKFDFLDSERKLRNSFTELGNSIEGLQKDFKDTIDVFTTDITKDIDGVKVGSYSGEEIPKPGEGFTEDAASQTQTYSSDYSGSSSSGGGRWKPLLDLIHTVESSTDKQNNGYDAQNGAPRGVRPGLSKMTIGEIARSAPGASGRYQQMPQFLLDRAKAAGYNEKTVFSPEVQDTLAIKLIEGRGGNAWLSGKMSTEQFMQGLSQEWAALPNASGKFAYSGQSSSLRPDKVKSVLEQVKKGPSQQDQKSSAPSTQIVQVPAGKIKPIIGDRLGAGRNHGGVDLAVPNGTPLRAISDGTIVDSDNDPGGWGNFLVMKDDRGIYHLYGHMQSGYKRSGPVKRGEVIGKVGMTGRTSGPHLHWESGSGWNGGVITGRFDPLNKYSQFAPFNTPYSVIPQEQKSQQAQISSAPTQQRQQAVAQQITPERKGQDIAVVVPSSQQPQQSAASSGGSSQQSSGPSMGELLNNFMKQKFLLDLSYL